jgi:FG-GAP-like repeat
LGSHAYCLSFRGQTAFVPGRSFTADDAPAASACGPLVPLSKTYTAPWHMHPVDERFRGPNALATVDLNADGFTDYVTNYEFDQRYMIELHPGAGGAVREPWPTVTAYALATGPTGTDTENAAMADFDGDGHLDLVGAQGWHFTGTFEGQNAGIRLVFGPPTAEIFDPERWIDAGRIPDTIDQGHFLWVEPFDMNGDGATDILAGGREFDPTGAKASIRWIEAPALPADRRNLALWTSHNLDPDQFDGHGFVLDDVDRDGDQDLLDANADFDTPEEEETVHWYENPGTGTPAQDTPWTKHELYRGPEFYPKPQLSVGDLDGDGLRDFVTQVADRVYWFRKISVRPVAFERIVIQKPAVTQFNARPIRIVDLDGDGRLDLFGMMTHDNGFIFGDKASAFWMTYEGTTPTATNWTTHVVKWGSGDPMQLFTFGEKWDQVQFDDVDRDGDLDIVANCEEWWADTAEFRSWLDPALDPTSVAVVWFENRLQEPGYAFAERDGRCVIEAEHWSGLGDGTWVKHARASGYGGDGYMQDHEAARTIVPGFADTSGLRYVATVAGGTYHLWFRRRIPSAWGSSAGGPLSDSTWLGIDGDLVGTVDDGNGAVDTWAWVRTPGPVTLSPGAHVIDLRVRERGYAVDRLLLTTDANETPTGTGPRPRCPSPAPASRV